MTAYKLPICLVGHAPAKLNLFFEIIGKRADGYHDVCSVCCPVNVFDTLFFEAQNSSEVEFICDRGSASANTCGIPTGSDNLVVRAIELLRKLFDVQSGCRVQLVKRIPCQAGMGGGSSDAATAIRLASKAWNLRLTPRELMELGAELGSDVPLFFMEGPSLGYGRGEQVEPVGGIPRLDFVIVKPPEGISTAEVFQACSAELITDRRSPERLLSGLRSGNYGEIASGMFNRLEATSRKLCPKIGQIRRMFEKLDCLAHQMTGSGTAWFALCRSKRQANQLALQLRQADMGSIFVAHSVTATD